MRDLLLDVKYAIRTFRQAPLMSLLVAGSLALGIAANTTVFSFVNAIQFKPLPVADEATLVDVHETSATRLCAGCAVGTSYAGFLEWCARTQSFEAIAAYREDRFVVAGGSGPERIGGALVSAGLFEMLGVQPALGRKFVDGDDRPGAEPVVILSDTLWRRRFDAASGILGRVIRVDGVHRTVVGVMQDRFAFPEYAQLWIPLGQSGTTMDRAIRSLGVIARRRTGVTLDAARAEMRTIAAAQALENPATNEGWSAGVVSLREDMTGETAMASIVLLGAVGFVLLIACANVANLLLVRASERGREIAIRVALGATRGRIVRLVLTESLAFAIAGGVAGVVAAIWASRLLVAQFGVEAPYWIQFGLDWKVFAYCAAVTGAVAVLCGAMPAVHSARADIRGAIQDGASGPVRPAGRRIRSVLAAGQLALALVLLAGAGLLIKTVLGMFIMPLRYDPAHVLVGDLHLQSLRYESGSAASLFASRLLEALQRVPGNRAALSNTVFFAGFGATRRQIEVAGEPAAAADASPSFYHAVTRDYFPIYGMAVREGRLFADREAGAAVVNEEMVRRLWGGRSVLGERFRFNDAVTGSRWFTVVGVVADEAELLNADRRPAAYVALAAAPGRELALHVSTSGDVSSAAAEIRREVASIDPDQPIEDLMTKEQALAAWAAPARFMVLLMSALAAVALMLAALGTYGVIAFAASQRLREIGIRLALGATPRQIQSLIAAAGLRLVAAGVVAGLAGAWASTRSLQGILAVTSPTDPAVFAWVTIALGSVGLLAAWIPARRAARVDPIVVLRNL